MESKVKQSKAKMELRFGAALLISSCGICTLLLAPSSYEDIQRKEFT